MLVNVKRSQYEGWFGTIYYVLDAQLELNPEEAELVNRHGIADLVIFDSENVDYYADATAQSASSVGYVQPTKEPFFDIMASFFTSVYHLGATAYNATMWSFSARITVQSLIDGTHLESEHVEEILESESLITKSIDLLKDRLTALTTFDGSEELHER